MAHCKEFCKGSLNTDRGLVSKNADGEARKGLQKNKDGNHPCLVGCKHNPTTEQAAKNLKASGASIGDVCLNNPFRYLLRG